MRRAAVALALVGLGACGGGGDDDDDDDLVGDSGMPADRTAPRVVSTSPEDGATNVDVTPTIVVTFDEEMDRNRGAIEIGGTVVNAMGGGNWNVAGTEVSFSISRAFDPDTEVTVTVLTDFADLAGNQLAETSSFSFTTVDEAAPVVIVTVPEEGSRDASRNLAEITITFNEPMAASGFTVGISGGEASIGEATFDGARETLTIPVEGLDYDTDYTVTLAGFEDANGNAWDPVPELEDGNLDFSTGPDMDPPQVVSAMPMEGQTDVDPDDLESIVVTFDEDMDTTVGLTQITSGGEIVNGVVSWDEARRVATIFPQAVLAYEGPASVALTGFRDVLGNNVASDASGGNGRLDFITGPDMFSPGVMSATPGEGETGVALDLAEISVTFTEEMDTSIVDFFLTLEGSDADPVLLTGTWDPGGVVIRFLVPVELGFTGNYGVDLTGAEDVSGNPLRDPDPVTMDGVLNFVSRGPSGENCGEALRIVDGTTVGGTTSFSLPAGDLADTDGGTASCDGNEVGIDAVFVYEKTTASLSDGGALLHIRAESKVGGENINVEVVRGTCAPADARFDPDQVTCLWARDTWDSYLDVGPGTYFVFVADGDEDEFDGLDVEIEERTTAPEGESCLDPFDTSSAIHSTPSAGIDLWEIDADDIVAFDMDRTWGGAGSVQCDDNSTYGDITGVDAVIAVEKTSEDSILVVTVDKPVSAATDLNVEILTSGCDPRDTPRTAAFCGANEDSHVFQGAVGFSGTVHVWVTAEATSDDWPAVDVRVEEVSPVAVGSACGRGTALSAGTNAVTLGSSDRYGAPSCFSGTGDVTWFEYTLSEEAVVVDPNGTGSYALVRPDDGFEFGCGVASDDPRGAILSVGDTLCIAVDNGAGTTSIDIVDVDYAGVGVMPTETGILPPLDDTGDEVSLSGDRWMAYDDSTLFMARSSTELIEADVDGGRATVHDATDGLSSSNIGFDGVSTGSSLYSLDDASGATTSRLYRLWDGAASPWSPRIWDTTPSYAAVDLHAMATDGSVFILASDEDTQVTLYSVPAGGGAPTLLGTNTALQGVVAIDVDDTYFFLAAEDDAGSFGVFRVTRSNVTAAPERMSPDIAFDDGASTGLGGLVVDAGTDATYLYVKSENPEGLHVIKDPGGATPRYLGRIFVTDDTDYAIAYDRGGDRLFVFDTRQGGTRRPRFLEFD